MWGFKDVCDACGSREWMQDPVDGNMFICTECDTSRVGLVPLAAVMCKACDKEWQVVDGAPVDPDGDYSTHYEDVHGSV